MRIIIALGIFLYTIFKINLAWIINQHVIYVISIGMIRINAAVICIYFAAVLYMFCLSTYNSHGSMSG